MEQHACIQLLPDALANQIAAGEVVQRPASVVKELLENSIDAGASDIKLIVRQAGKQLIQVVDNGSGMNEVDARMAFERHATSKIKEQQDLFAIHTLGFRGEALASIAAVAQVELQTRTEAQDLGLALRVEGGQVQAQEPVQCLKGSTLSVGNLFFNVPARRKFLKSDAAEMRHVLDEFHHVALSEPQIHFHLVQDNKEVYNLPPEKLHLRIARLFGNSFKGKLAKVQEATSALNLKGYIGAPELARKKRGFHFMFVNGRFIRHAYLNHAVKAAFDQVLPEEKHPFYVLFLQVDPADVDVNVHPTKTEVKFEDEQSLYALIRAAVQQSLNEHNLLPSIDFDYDEGNASFLRLERRQSTAQPSQNTPQEKQGPASKGHPNRRDPLHRSDSEAYIRNFNHMHHREALFEEERRKWQGDEESPKQAPQETNRPDSKPAAWTVQKDGILIWGKHALLNLKQNLGFILLDLGRARERIVYEQLLEQLTRSSQDAQHLVFEEVLEMPASDIQVLRQSVDALAKVGLFLEFQGINQIRVNRLPSFLNQAYLKSLLEGLVTELEKGKESQLPEMDRLARIMAGKAGASLGQIGREEVVHLWQELQQCSIQAYNPQGELIYRQMDQDLISQLLP